MAYPEVPGEFTAESQTTMRIYLLLLSIATVCLGCQRQPEPLTLAPGATLELFTLADMGDPGAAKATGPATGSPLFLKKPPIISTSDVATVALSETDVQTDDGKFSHRDVVIAVTLTPAGSAKMAAATANASGDQVAFVVNGKVISTPKIYSQITKSFKISAETDEILAAFKGLTNR